MVVPAVTSAQDLWRFSIPLADAGDADALLSMGVAKKMQGTSKKSKD
mgnify:CR=1 FL=1